MGAEASSPQKRGLQPAVVDGQGQTHVGHHWGVSDQSYSEVQGEGSALREVELSILVSDPIFTDADF